MKINNLKAFPENYGYRYGELGELSNWEIDNLNHFGFDEIWYYYAYGSYEGNGMMLMKKGNLYDAHNMGHCSCYGPLENINFSGKSLEDLKASYSAEGFKEWSNLYEAALLK
jgi:hypothetical protein